MNDTWLLSVSDVSCIG